jgi:hypothetical protein
MAQKIEKAIVAGGQSDGNAADLDASGFLRACHHEDFTYKDGTLRNSGADVPSWRR